MGYYSDRHDYVIWKDCCDLSLGLEDHSVLKAQWAIIIIIIITCVVSIITAPLSHLNYTSEFQIVIKKNTVLSHAKKKWTEFEIIVFCEITQTQETKYFTLYSSYMEFEDSRQR